MNRARLQAICLAFVMLGLAGCRYLPHDDSRSCDKLVDWNDRKACKEKAATEEKEWEKRAK